MKQRIKKQTISRMLQIFDNITRSLEDKRSYRGLLLLNGMKVLLINDKTTEKSAAALNVNVGYMSDPDELPGLAHFCEHMLFMGTKKYPAENDYNKFVTEHGGICNATTDTHETKYLFEVAPQYLKDTLDRFSQFFISPLFTESATEREINAVDSEHQNYVPEDTWRDSYLNAFLCNPSHPYNKFGTGNKQTLLELPRAKGINVRDALLKFHKQWYSSNIMTLAILGRESLNDLSKMAEDLFGGIENKKVEAPVWTEHPYTPEQLSTITTVVPLQDIRILRLYFPMPDLRPYYKSAPDYYLAHLCGHEGAGSLLSALKSHGWCSYLNSGSEPEFGFGAFQISADLTEEGLDHVDDIIKIVFQYINMLKRESPQEWIFNECSKIRNMLFRFKEKEQEFNYVYGLATNMLLFPFEDVLYGHSKMSEYNPNIITSILENFTPEKLRAYILAKKTEPQCSELEPIYGTKYQRNKISNQALEIYRSKVHCEDLKLPRPNEFIPTNFALEPLKNVTPYPEIILDTPFSRLWFKQDSEFLMPKVNINIKISTPFASLDPLSSNLTHIFMELFQDYLNEYTYDAELTGLGWYAYSHKQGISICFYGYTDKMNFLLTKILSHIKQFKIDKKRFEILHDNHEREIKNFEVDQPYAHTTYYMEILLSEHSWTKNNLIQACKCMTVENLEAFLPQLLSKIHVETLVHGNCNKCQALEVAKLIENNLNFSKCIPLYAQQMLNSREPKLEPGLQYLFSANHMYHKSSCTDVLFQCGVQGTENNMLLELLVQVLEEPCFGTLRTQEQLGYIVFCFLRRSNGAQGLQILVQSEYPPEYVDSRIEAFIADMKSYLNDMTEEEFEQHKESLSVQRLEKPKTLTDLTHLYWLEILCQQYHFNRNAFEVTHLKNVTKNQLLTFFMDKIDIFGADRRKLAIYVISKVEPLQHQDKLNDNYPAQDYNIITDFISFKRSKGLYPLAKPYLNIPIKGNPYKL